MKCKLLKIIFSIVKDSSCNPEKVFSIIGELKLLEESGKCN